jgi:uncharacterized protein YjdB
LIGNNEGSYEFIMKISFDNSTLSGDAELSAALPFKTYGADRFILRKAIPIPVAVTGVSLDQNSLTMNEDDTEQLTATVVDGLVTAVSTGTATITVKTTDGNFTDTCAVTVS